jgi:pyruvate/2-oxoglutarate dehydrogenase complex dihydrolipoamide acyltransferase (E2) component
LIAPLQGGQLLMARVELRLPEFDLGNVPVVACSWYAAIGERVVEGDRLVEILAGDVTIDLPSPAAGIIIQRLAELDDPLQSGQVLAVIETI